MTGHDHSDVAHRGHDDDHDHRANPVLVEVTRGDMVESRHRGAVAVVRADGSVPYACGRIDAPVYPRSAIKPVQALPLIETGAADAFDVTPAEIALACASHSAEPRHLAAVASWLDRLGLSVDDLECGPTWPYDAAVARDMVRAGQTPTPLHNCCSGKHTGFLTLAKHLGVPTKGYARATHPVQQRVLGAIEQLAGIDPSGGPMPCGRDGCAIPTWGVPLGNLALAWAQLAAPDDLPPARADAARRALAAMAAYPENVGGENRFCTNLIRATNGAALVKIGAEGVYCAALPDWGLGVALKIDDGARRACEVTLAAVLAHIGVESPELDAMAGAAVVNSVDDEVGRLRALIPGQRA